MSSAVCIDAGELKPCGLAMASISFAHLDFVAGMDSLFIVIVRAVS